MNALLWTLLDLLLAAMLLGLGWAAVSTRDLKRGVALFMAFGLLLALAWARLRAPDLALAEAAIGAGIAGALLLAALRSEPHDGQPAAVPSRVVLWTLNLFSVLLAVAVAWALLSALAMGDGVRLAPTVKEHLAQSGVSNPVTGVLLNFRAYDTLLELAVILSAVLGVLALGPAQPGFRLPGPVLYGLIRWLVPLLIVTGGYLLWVGAHAPGGAFQASATLAAAAVLLRLGGVDGAGLPAAAVSRWLLAAGLLAFLAVGLLATAFGYGFLQYPPDWAAGLILMIESAATLSIAVALALAYIGGRPSRWAQPVSAHTHTTEGGTH